MATFLHTQLFLSYHGQRFNDASVWVVDNNDDIIGLLPAAVAPNDEQQVVSHPGITFGGLLHQGKLKGELMVDALQAITAYYKNKGFTSLIYKTVPTIYHHTPSEDDRYALFRLNAQRSRCDLSVTVDTPWRPAWTKKRKKNMKQVAKQNIICKQGYEQLDIFWPILIERLKAAHQAMPVHSFEEIQLLAQRFPHQIECWVGYKNDTPIGGTVLFKHHYNNQPICTHTQYIAATEAGTQIAGLDAVLEEAIQANQQQGYRYFDFGHSNTDGGWTLNQPLYRFKHKFGGGGTVYETYTLNL